MARGSLYVQCLYKSMAPLITYCQRRTGIRIFKHMVSQAMAMSSGQDHMDRTQENSRQQVVSSASVVDIKDLSPSVKTLTLEVQNRNFFFKPGQWLDMIIPGVEKVGGYSMTSAPELLTRKHQLQLAVKFSTHPPAHWIHTKCKQDDKVLIRAGGDFFYFPDKSQASKDVLLLAGGVGINPLYSILQHFVDIHPHAELPNKAPRLSLLYSASSEEELIFKDEMLRMKDTNDSLQLKFFCTKERENIQSQSYLSRRILSEDVHSAFNFVDKSMALVYICGPGSFIKATESFCLGVGISQENIFYETWW